MIPFEKCPVCGGEVIIKNVEKLIRGGNNTAVVKIKAEVCLHCGERLYSKETISRFEEIRLKLKRNDIANFKELGHSYQAVA
jgi:YgiT-type zinc finger domain-containing protein